jgi:hypothetical protein
MKRLPIKPRHILFAVVLVIVVILIIDFNQRVSELNRLTGILEDVQAQGTAVMETQVALLTQVSYAGSDAYPEQWAYENGWKREADNLIVPVPVGTPLATPVEAAAQPTPAPANWQVWWDLFFGENP